MQQWEKCSPSFQEQSLACDRMPPGTDKVAAQEELLRTAQESGSFAEEFVARVDLVAALYHVPNDPRNFHHFGWLRGSLAPENSLAHEDRHMVLWRLKWAMDQIVGMPQVPLATARATIDDFEALLRAEGLALRPVHGARARLARDCGQPDTVGAELTHWQAAARDRMSDCEACEARAIASLIRPSDPARAVDLLRPAVDGELTCSDEPSRSLAARSRALLDVGRTEEAIDHIRRGWHLAKDDLNQAAVVARLLHGFIRVGSVDRATDLLVERAAWVDQLPDADDRLAFYPVAALVLRTATDRGLAPESILGVTATVLADRLEREARDLATALDARNGSTVAMESVESVLGTPVAQETLLPPTRIVEAEQPRAAAATTIPPTDSITARGARMREYLATVSDDVESEVQAWLRDREQLLAEVADSEWADVAVLERVSARDTGPEYAARLACARSAAQRAGDDVAILRIDAESAVAQASDNRDPAAPPPGFTEVGAAARARAIEIAAALEARGALAEAGGVWRLLAWFAPGADRSQDSARAADLLERAGLADRTTLVRLERVMALVQSDPQAARSALEVVEPSVGQHPLLSLMAMDARAQIAHREGDLDSAVTIIRQVLDRDLPGRTRTGMRVRLADLLVDASRWEELLPVAREVVDDGVSQGSGHLLAIGQRLLGLAYVETGRFVEGAELLEAALPVVSEKQPDLVGPTAWALGNALSGMAEWAGARSAFASASAGFEAHGRLHEASHAQMRAGDAAWDAGDREAAAAHFDDAVSKARDTSTIDVLVQSSRSRAALRVQGGEVEAGLADLDRVVADAGALIVSTGQNPEDFDFSGVRPGILRQGAHLLAEAGRIDAAVTRIRQAEESVEGLYAVVLRSERGAFLADADRLGECESLLREVLPELAAGDLSRERVNAAGALARALDRAGRSAEAETVWTAYGPDAT